jgi:murein DD-endopeptidase MepM/ murein hydrolase activator NlpD
MRFLAFLLLFIFAWSVNAPGAISPEEQKLQGIKKQLQQSKQKLRKTKKEEQAVLGRLVVIEKELKKTRNTLDRAQKKIKVNEDRIGVLSSELRMTEEDFKKEEGKLKSRVKEVYKTTGLNYLELLISSRTMSDFLNRLYFFGKIIDHDAKLVQKTGEVVRAVKQKRAVLQDKTNEVRSLARVVAEKKTEVAAKAKEKKKVYKSLKQRRREYEARVAELEKSSKDLEVLILKKIAARKGAKVKGSGKMAWPLRGRITSRFGYRRHPLWGGRSYHTGLDVAAKYGTPIKAADAGEVIFSGWWDGYGKAVVVDHGSKTTTVYAHLSRIYKKVGAVVAKGQVVGLVGSTGYSTGPHLHFEVRKNGKPTNPMGYLK